MIGALSGDFLGAVLIAALCLLMFCSAIIWLRRKHFTPRSPRLFVSAIGGVSAVRRCHDSTTATRETSCCDREERYESGSLTNQTPLSRISQKLGKCFRHRLPRASHEDIHDQKCPVVIDSDGSDKLGKGSATRFSTKIFETPQCPSLHFMVGGASK